VNFHGWVWVPSYGTLPIIASVSLTHLPCLFACFYESVSRVYAVFSTCLSTCVARAACFVFGSISLTAFLFSFFSSYKINRHLCHGACWCAHNPANMPTLVSHLRIISLIPAYVCPNMYTHSPPLPYSYTFITIFISMFCVLFSIYHHVFVFFLFFL